MSAHGRKRTITWSVLVMIERPLSEKVDILPIKRKAQFLPDTSVLLYLGTSMGHVRVSAEERPYLFTYGPDR